MEYVVYERLEDSTIELKGAWTDISDATMALEELMRDGLDVWMVTRRERNVA